GHVPHSRLLSDPGRRGRPPGGEHNPAAAGFLSPCSPAARTVGGMNVQPPFRDRGGMFVYPAHHHGGPGALAWTIFALQLLALLGLGALLATAVAAPRWRRSAAPVVTSPPLEVLRLRYA